MSTLHLSSVSSDYHVIGTTKLFLIVISKPSSQLIFMCKPSIDISSKTSLHRAIKHDKPQVSTHSLHNLDF